MRPQHLGSLPTTLSPTGTLGTFHGPETPAFPFNNTFRDLLSGVYSAQSIRESFDEFKERINDLKTEFGKFSRECRQLGRSYALITAVRELTDKLEHMLSMFEENMNELCHLIRDTQSIRIQPTTTPNHTISISASFEQVAAAFEDFRERLNEFRDYTNENVKFKGLIKLFERDLNYRAFCLKAYKDRYNPTNMRLFIHGLTQEVKNDLDEILSALKFLNTYGVPAMQYEQKRDADSVLNMSTVATFFSAVTATTLQMSVGIQDKSLPSTVMIIVNTFWFCSLVLSIGAALNSLMAAAWKSTTYGTRGRRLPIWVTIWIHASAPIFLILSIACFSAGLVLFSYGSQQARVTSFVTLISTVISCFGFITVASWIMYEQWIVPNIPKMTWLCGGKERSGGDVGATHDTKLGRPVSRRTRSDSISELSVASTESDESSFNITSLLSGLKSLALPETSHPHSDPENYPVNINPGTEDHHSQEQKSKKGWTASARAISFESLATKEFWRKTARAVPRMSLPTRSSSEPKLGEKSASLASDPPPFTSMSNEPSYRAFRTEFGVVQDLEFSPHGKLLATTNYDEHHKQSRTVCYITETYAHTFRFKHLPGQIAKQISWSVDGSEILVRLDHSMDILDSQCRLVASIRRPHRIESAAWCDASNEEVLSVERHIVFKLSLDGNVLAKHRFENILLRDLAVIPGGRFLLVVGRVNISHEENVPSNSRGEKQLILYDMGSREYLSRNPLLDDVRHITLSKKMCRDSTGFEVLLGHKNKPPPQLWTLSPHLIGPHRLKPKSGHIQLSYELVGSGYFAGEQEDVILCADEEGNVHILDREHSRAIHKVEAQVVMNNWRCIAYCPIQNASSTVFATVGANGFKIWTVSLPTVLPGSESSETLRISTSSLLSTARPVTIFEEAITPTETQIAEATNVPGAKRTSV